MLLDSYCAERAPIARQIVIRANQSIGEFGPVFQPLGMTGGTDCDKIRTNMKARADASNAGETQPAALREVMPSRNTISTRIGWR